MKSGNLSLSAQRDSTKPGKQIVPDSIRTFKINDLPGLRGWQEAWEPRRKVLSPQEGAAEILAALQKYGTEVSEINPENQDGQET